MKQRKPNIQQVSLRDTLEVVPLFVGNNITLLHSIKRVHKIYRNPDHVIIF